MLLNGWRISAPKKATTWQRHQGIIVWKLDMHVRKFIDIVWRSRKFPKTFTYTRVIRLGQKRGSIHRVNWSEAYWKRTKMSGSAVNWCLQLDKFMNYVTWVNISRQTFLCHQMDEIYTGSVSMSGNLCQTFAEQKLILDSKKHENYPNVNLFHSIQSQAWNHPRVPIDI